MGLRFIFESNLSLRINLSDRINMESLVLMQTKIILQWFSILVTLAAKMAGFRNDFGYFNLINFIYSRGPLILCTPYFVMFPLFCTIFRF